MMRLVVAGMAAAFVSASAWAMPATVPVDVQGSTIPVQYKKDPPRKGPHAKPGHKHTKPAHKHGRKHGHSHYKPGHKYKSAPKGWRRHGARPSDWQRRGCIVVGPVWFCP